MAKRVLTLLINAATGIILLTGCGTSYYYAEFIHPSKAFIPADVYRVGVVNRAVGSQNEALIYTNGVPLEGIRGLPLKALEKTIDELRKNNEALGRFEMIPISLPPRLKTGRNFMRDQLSMEQVDSICSYLNIDGIISVEGLELSIRTRGSVDVVTVIDPAGMPLRVPEFSNESQISLSVGWRFYDGRFKVLADTYNESYQTVYTNVAYSEQEAYQAGKEDLSVSQVASMAALDYFTRISPYWKEDFRLYYQTGSEVMYRTAYNLEYDGNWEEAARQWQPLTDSPVVNIAFRARYNMAVAYEMLGNPREAREWLLKATALKQNKHTRKYIQVLERQILVYDVVNIQLGITE